MSEVLASGREALQRRSWAEALQALTQADQEADLSPSDLELLAEAAWWSGHPDEATQALERAYAGYMQAGDHLSAAAVALRVAELAFRRMSYSIAGGWVARADRLLRDESESVVHAWLEFIHAAEALAHRNDPDDTIVHADRAIALGRKYGSSDVQSIALSFKGAALLKKGRVAEGLALIDEATASATSGELEPKVACDVYCVTIAACSDLADYRRAGEWTDEAERWMQRHAIRGYQGVCRVHRAELKRLRGSWSEAEQEARRACEELERYRLLDAVGFAYYEVGEVRLHMGDLAAAEEAFDRAYEYGRNPQPGLALLLLARGEIDEAARSIVGSLSGGPGESIEDDPLVRGRLLPAQVEIALASDDVETARAATEELENIAREYTSPVWEAAALTARGAVQLQEGDPVAAAGALSRAWRLWRQIDLPYERAKARMLLGQARAAAGERSAARLELRAARSTFERLGATLDVQKFDQLLDVEPVGGVRASDEERHRATRTFMFTDIVTSTDLIGLIGDAAWENLLRWHDRALRADFAEHGGEEVNHTGDGFFVAFDRARDGVECAVAIQRRLAEHRQEHGFAPWVRIGLHTAEATRREDSYLGQGVHAAARVGSLADKEQIVVSAPTLQAAGTLRFQVSELRAVHLKGNSEAVEVATVEWR
ncbi:MAG TPA: adenylate/guanylate cyclase domain-containing protein [Nitriliruptorales bacterium]|nr:adenylate/guanylate cyclase domain-containing protein [Nitriliruptorales bacterium]